MILLGLGTGSMCHLFLLYVELNNVFRFRVFQCHFSTVSRFLFPRFQLPQCWHGRTECWKLPAFSPNIQNVVTNFSCWQCLCTLLGHISLLYKQLLQCTLLKSFTVPSALLTKFIKKFHMKLFWHQVSFSQNFPLKHARVVLTAFCQCSSFVVNGIAQI